MCLCEKKFLCFRVDFGHKLASFLFLMLLCEKVFVISLYYL